VAGRGLAGDEGTRSEVSVRVITNLNFLSEKNMSTYKVVSAISPQDLEKRLNENAEMFKFVQVFFAPGTGFLAILERKNQELAK
jgi:hypothetical protein